MKFLVFFTICTLLIGSSSFAQDSDDELSNYFDDGGISTAKNTVKFNLASAVSGDFTISYERILKSNWGFEIGFGRLADYYNPDLYEYFSNNEDLEDIEIPNPTGGYSYIISPKYYYLDDAPLDVYASIEYRYRFYDYINNTSITVRDITANYGFQFMVYKKLIMDVNYGLGFRAKTLEINNVEESTINLTMPLSVKVGYLF